MTPTEQPKRLGDPDLRIVQQVMDDARRAGTTQFQVVALVHPGDVRDHVLLLDPEDDDVWSVPVAWVHPTETVALTLDWLCDRHVGLRTWEASFARAATYESPDGTEVLQLAFDVTAPLDGRMTWQGPCQWWHVGNDPAPLHRLARPVLEKLQTEADTSAEASADRVVEELDAACLTGEGVSP